MRRLLVCLCVVVLALCGCSSVNTSSSSSSDVSFKERIEQGKEKLLGYSDYIIANEYSGEVFSTSLIVRSGDVQYVEYPISDSGEVETRSFLEGGTYGLSEYRDTDGRWYSLTSDAIVRYPDTFGIYRDDLRVMYIDRLLEGGYNFQAKEQVTLQTSEGNETFDVIAFDTDVLAVRDTVANPEYGAYRSGADTTKNLDAKNYAELVVQDITDVFTCSTVQCQVLLDKLGNLRGVYIIAKGGGSHLYNSAIVVNLHNEVVRKKPDFSSARPFVENLIAVGFATSGATSYDNAAEMLSDMISQESSGGETIETE